MGAWRRFVLVLTAWALLPSGAHAQAGVREGDVIFHTSRSAQSLAIQRATNSPYSHMGIVLLRAGRACVLEAVATVRCTPLQAWIERGIAGRYVVKRMSNADTWWTPARLAKLRAAAQRYEGRAYDFAFDWSDAKMYCSELVWKIYRDAFDIKLGKLQRMREFDLSDAHVKAKLRERYGKRVPLQQFVVAPSAVFAASELVTVLER